MATDIIPPPATAAAGVDPWLLEILCAAGSHGNTNWSTLNTSGGIAGSDVESSGIVNDEIYWDLGFSAGTWDMTLVHFKGPNRGIYTVSLDGVTIGTFDGFAAAGTLNQLGVITGLVVTAGKHRVKLKMAAKNAGSSAFFGCAQYVQWRRM